MIVFSVYSFLSSLVIFDLVDEGILHRRRCCVGVGFSFPG